MKNFFNSLFWKISAVFLLILIVISAIYIYISVETAEMYFQETRQKLDMKIAPHIASFNDFFQRDSINTSVLKRVFYNVMVINPSIEVYLLDTTGTILAYDAPANSVKLKRIPLKPLNEYIHSGNNKFLMSVDPKNPEIRKAFSAAKVYHKGKFRGYVYVILGGQQYENTSQLLFGSYIIKLGVRSMMIALIAAALIGFIAIGFIVRNLRKIIYVIRDFQKGNLKARINLKSKGELQEFAGSFNEMANTIVSNLNKIKMMDKERRDLIANVSHDLRTPLAIIRGYVETVLIKSDSLSAEERKKYLKTTLKSMGRLQILVEELFELSKLEAKENLPKKENFSLAELLQDIQQKNLVIAESKNITLELNIAENLPFICADIRMIEKVFQNLMDNAFKFTPPAGKILITLLKNERSLVAQVSDTGIGISEEEIPQIFDRYHQTKRVSSQDVQGIGLGLAIVKKILDLHNLGIKVESKLSQGTNFILEFPLDHK